jgi:hypothetical protein
MTRYPVAYYLAKIVLKLLLGLITRISSHPELALIDRLKLAENEEN